MNLNLSEIHFKGWKASDKRALDRAKSFDDLAEIAFSVLRRLGFKCHLVSAPISTGGFGSIEENNAVIVGVIEYLTRWGYPIFSQMPFEDRIVVLYRAWHKAHPKEKYCTPILDDFYKPILSSGFISTIHFVHGYDSSVGAMWEHENCDGWNIRREYLEKSLSVGCHTKWLAGRSSCQR